MWHVWERAAQSRRSYPGQKVRARPQHSRPVAAIGFLWIHLDIFAGEPVRRSGEWSMGSGQSASTVWTQRFTKHTKSQTRGRRETPRSWSRWVTLLVSLMNWHMVPTEWKAQSLLPCLSFTCFICLAAWSNLWILPWIYVSNGIFSFHNNMQWH